MSVRVNRKPEVDFVAWAESEGLEIFVEDRGLRTKLPRYYAHIANCEIRRGSLLVSVFGNGSTPEEAISNAAPEYGECHLVIDAMKPGCREIHSPIFRALRAVDVESLLEGR